MSSRSISLELATFVAFACLCWVGGCGGEGAACNTGAGCDEGLVCVDGVCVPENAPGTCDPDTIDPALCGADCACDPESPSICGTICIDPICGGFENFDTAGCGQDGRCVCICVENVCTDPP